MARLGDSAKDHAFVCIHVRDGEPATEALHGPNGVWVLRCEHKHAIGDFVATRVGAVVDRDPSLGELGDAPRGAQARRTGAGARWVVKAESPPEAPQGGAKLLSFARAVADRFRHASDRLRDTIARVGWMVMVVEGNASGPPFAYTIGLFHSFRHPELIMFGPRPQAHAQMLNLCGETVKAGTTLTEDLLLDEVMVRHPVAFRVFQPARYPDHLGRALDYYGSLFPALQVLWPDRHGRFPWEPECVAEVRDIQPLR